MRHSDHRGVCRPLKPTAPDVVQRQMVFHHFTPIVSISCSSFPRFISDNRSMFWLSSSVGKRARPSNQSCARVKCGVTWQPYPEAMFSSYFTSSACLMNTQYAKCTWVPVTGDVRRIHNDSNMEWGGEAGNTRCPSLPLVKEVLGGFDRPV